MGKEESEEELVEEVMKIRSQMPMIGGKKLYYLISPKSIGRDKFFKLLGRRGLLIKARRYRAKTTDSKHRFRMYGNLIKELEIRTVNQCTYQIEHI